MSSGYVVVVGTEDDRAGCEIWSSTIGLRRDGIGADDSSYDNNILELFGAV